MSANPREGAAPTPPPPAAPSPSFDGDPKAAAKQLLQDLIFRAELFPQFARHLEGAIRAMQFEVKREPESGRSSIVRALENNFDGATFEELGDDTHLSPEDLRRSLTELFVLRLVDCRPTRIRVGTRQDPELLLAVQAAVDHGMMIGRHDKRVEHIFCLTHTPAGSDYAAPRREHSSTESLMRSLAD